MASVARVGYIVPHEWQPLVDALRAAGCQAEGVCGRMIDGVLRTAVEAANADTCTGPGWWRSGWLASTPAAAESVAADGLPLAPTLSAAPPWIAAIDLAKAIRACVEPAAAQAQLLTLLAALPRAVDSGAWTYRLCRAMIAQRGIGVLVTTCTSNVVGRAVVAAGRSGGVPVVHLQHACQADPAAWAWFAAQTPGDVVCVPGSRDQDWWQRCFAAHGVPLAAQPPVVVTGHPLWPPPAPVAAVAGDAASPDAVRPLRVVWLTQSPTNAACGAPAFWGSRDVPEQAWHAWLAAVPLLVSAARQLPLPAGAPARTLHVVVKCRSGEFGDYVAQWQREAAAAWAGTAGLRWELTAAPLPEVLAGAALVLGQESNGQVEALRCGVPVLNVARAGACLFADDPRVPTVPPHPAHLAKAAFVALFQPVQDAHWWQDIAAAYDRGVDGQAMQRVVAVIQHWAQTPWQPSPVHSPPAATASAASVEALV